MFFENIHYKIEFYVILKQIQIISNPNVDNNDWGQLWGQIKYCHIVILFNIN